MQVEFLHLDYMDKLIDLHDECIKYPAATYYMQVDKDSMNKAHMPKGSLLVIDKALIAVDGDIVVVSVDGEFMTKWLEQREGKIRLLPESTNPKYKPVEITEGMELIIWGVVTILLLILNEISYVLPCGLQ